MKKILTLGTLMLALSGVAFGDTGIEAKLGALESKLANLEQQEDARFAQEEQIAANAQEKLGVLNQYYNASQQRYNYLQSTYESSLYKEDNKALAGQYEQLIDSLGNMIATEKKKIEEFNLLKSVREN